MVSTTILKVTVCRCLIASRGVSPSYLLPIEWISSSTIWLKGRLSLR